VQCLRQNAADLELRLICSLCLLVLHTQAKSPSKKDAVAASTGATPKSAKKSTAGASSAGKAAAKSPRGRSSTPARGKASAADAVASPKAASKSPSGRPVRRRLV